VVLLEVRAHQAVEQHPQLVHVHEAVAVEVGSQEGVRNPQLLPVYESEDGVDGAGTWACPYSLVASNFLGRQGDHE
jgi:hypothetical protein